MKLSQAILLGGLALGGAAGCESMFNETERLRCPEVVFACKPDEIIRGECRRVINKCLKNPKVEKEVARYDTPKDILVCGIITLSIIAIGEVLIPEIARRKVRRKKPQPPDAE